MQWKFVKIIGLALLMYNTLVMAQKNPHVNLTLECDNCHTTKDWKLVMFDHRIVNYPLEGQHKGLSCEQCHSIEDFSRVAPGCAACHQDVHQEKLGRECSTCHTPEHWTVLDVLVAHRNTTFPLVGVHARLDCQACHLSEIEGEYSFIQSECVACHQSNYQNAQNPEHTGMGFSIRCEDCHNLTGWRPANFSGHDGYFPIYSGEHAGKWDTCSDCHVVPGNYQQFSCYDGCHEHNQAKMDDEHDEVSGYVFESNACLSCHPSGGE